MTCRVACRAERPSGLVWIPQQMQSSVPAEEELWGFVWGTREEPLRLLQLRLTLRHLRRRLGQMFLGLMQLQVLDWHM